MAIKLDERTRAVFDAALPAISAFKQTFGRNISADFIAELYAARELDLELPDGMNQPGCDAVDRAGTRYQIKYRSPNTQNVDVNNFDFDQLVLVNLDDDYALRGMWCLPTERAKPLFTFREKFRKYQATQARIKLEATKVR